MKKHLKLALLHMDIGHKQVETNRKRLLELANEAAGRGAGIILAPEPAVSGYSFQSRDDIATFAESASGPTATALAETATAPSASRTGWISRPCRQTPTLEHFTGVQPQNPHHRAHILCKLQNYMLKLTLQRQSRIELCRTAAK